MKFTLTIDMDNAAFDDDPRLELSRVVIDVGVNGVHFGDADNVRDFNGNTVGRWEITDG